MITRWIDGWPWWVWLALGVGCGWCLYYDVTKVRERAAQRAAPPGQPAPGGPGAVDALLAEARAILVEAAGEVPGAAG